MPLKRIRHVLAVGMSAACLFGAMTASAQDKPNWRDGRKVFKKCETCHSFKAGEHRFGPSLHRVMGTKAGTNTDFPYSKAMVEKGATGLVWTDETLYAFLEAPKKVVPKTKMTFPGLKRAKDRRNVIAYVKRKSKR